MIRTPIWFERYSFIKDCLKLREEGSEGATVGPRSSWILGSTGEDALEPPSQNQGRKAMILGYLGGL